MNSGPLQYSFHWHSRIKIVNVDLLSFYQLMLQYIKSFYVKTSLHAHYDFSSQPYTIGVQNGHVFLYPIYN